MPADAKDMRIAASMAAHIAYRDARLGKMGAASPVRRIDPKTGEMMPDTAIAASTPAKRFKRQSNPVV